MERFIKLNNELEKTHFNNNSSFNLGNLVHSLQQKNFSISTLKGLNQFKNIPKISCSFLNDELFMMVPNSKDFFELGNITQYSINPVPILDFINDMKSIFKIVDILKLDSNLKL